MAPLHLTLLAQTTSVVKQVASTAEVLDFALEGEDLFGHRWSYGFKLLHLIIRWSHKLDSLE